MNTKMSPRRVARSVEAIAPRPILVAAICFAMLALAACHKTPSSGEAKSAPEGKSAPETKSAPDAKAAGAAKAAEGKEPQKEAGEGVSLTPEQIEKIGLQTEDVKAIDYAEETAGYGTVIPHETIAQAVAELTTAEATEKQSRSALARIQRLSGTPGAMSADVEETNARQAAVDNAALALARQRLSATFGQTPPWSHGGNQALLQALANGSTLLVRATFPLGTLPEGTPKTLRASRIGTASTGKRWKLSSVWPAPADAGVPGRSFFATLHGGDAGEGERIIVWAPIGSAQSGALIPAQAAVISENKYWCYVQTKPGMFVRAEIDTGKPFENGYFVTDGVKAGDKVVVKAAAQLLAQESNSGAEAD
ncbi:MAG: hypothetical protein M3N91_02925 [Pseudomonadota bacterium]|nr:hypothetical protein [Pseudomonadota bacterium]